MERLSDLFFELSNEERINILYNLRENKMNVTLLAKRINTTTQECSRHISRLTDITLVQKNTDGTYSITPYGRLTLRLLLGQLFASSNHQYFNTHTLEQLPSRIVSRIHELNDSRFIHDIWVTFHLMENLFKKAEEYIWMMHNLYPLNILPLGLEALKRGVKLRSIDSIIKEEHKRLDTERPSYINAEDEEYLLESWKEGNLEIRLLEVIQVLLYLTEKEAIIAFPLVDGSFDYTGFATVQPAGLRLCRDIFEYYWSLCISPSQEMIHKSHNVRMQYHRDSEK